MKVISFKISEDLAWLIEQTAKREGITRSELLRRAIEEYLLKRKRGRVIATRKIKIYL